MKVFVTGATGAHVGSDADVMAPWREKPAANRNRLGERLRQFFGANDARPVVSPTGEPRGDTTRLLKTG